MGFGLILIHSLAFSKPRMAKTQRKTLLSSNLDCIEKLVDCIKRFNNDEIDAEVAEKCGFKVEIVSGSYDNIKITTREDLKLAESLLIDH
jgi:hypothetical protein